MIFVGTDLVLLYTNRCRRDHIGGTRDDDDKIDFDVGEEAEDAPGYTL